MRERHGLTMEVSLAVPAGSLDFGERCVDTRHHGRGRRGAATRRAGWRRHGMAVALRSRRPRELTPLEQSPFRRGQIVGSLGESVGARLAKT